jgi:Reverse transcriptase (RNA-dependent DNA polymerase)
MNLTLNKIYTSINSGHPTLLVSLDSKAAFNTVTHRILLSRLSSSFDVSRTAFPWLSSYRIGRSQTTFCKLFIIYSKLFFWCSSRVSARPHSFSIYVSPVYHIAQSFTISHQQYADDIFLRITLSASQPHSGIQHLEQCFVFLYSWFSANGMSLNTSKSNSILFCSNQRLCNFPPDMYVDVAHCNIPVTDSLLTLGITLDADPQPCRK